MLLKKFKNNQKLEEILLNFIEVLRINILMVDLQGNSILVPNTDHYGWNWASKFGVLQYLGTPQLLSNFQKEDQYLSSIDAFGLHSFAIPVVFNGNKNTVGYLIVGPVILNKQLEQSQYRAITHDLNLSFSDFLACLNEVRVVSFNSMRSILDLLFELSRYALRMELTEKRQPVAENNQGQVTHSIFTTLLDLSMALTQADCGSIMLLNKLTNELSIQIFKGIDLQKFQNTPIKLGEGIAGLAAQKKEPFVINKGRSNNRIRHLLKRPELKCAMVLPILKNNNEVLGVMNISTHQAKSRLATHSKEMLRSLIEITSGTFSNFQT